MAPVLIPRTCTFFCDRARRRPYPGMRTRMILLVLSVLVACGGSGDGDDAPTMPGEEDFTPPPSNNGGGQPPGATDVTCQSGSDCDYWFCRCADGAVVNSALCVNSYCMDAASACPDACAYFDHGAWTGSAGGGPGTSQPLECGGYGSSDPDCDACFADECCDEGAACGENPDCEPYWDCAVACDGDPICRDECDAAYPDGAGVYAALESCLLDGCYDECVAP
jgi:hypothetical protein